MHETTILYISDDPLCISKGLLEQAVILVWGRANVGGYKDGNDQRIDGNDTRHNDWDERLQHKS